VRMKFSVLGMKFSVVGAGAAEAHSIPLVFIAIVLLQS